MVGGGEDMFQTEVAHQASPYPTREPELGASFPGSAPSALVERGKKFRERSQSLQQESVQVQSVRPGASRVFQEKLSDLN